MEDDVNDPRYDDDGSLVDDDLVDQTEEEEVLEEDVGILNATQNSQSSVAQTILFPQTNAARDIRPKRRLYHPAGR